MVNSVFWGLDTRRFDSYSRIWIYGGKKKKKLESERKICPSPERKENIIEAMKVQTAF